MAKIIGQIQEQEIKARIKRSKKVRYQKPLKVKIGPILKAALESKS